MRDVLNDLIASVFFMIYIYIVHCYTLYLVPNQKPKVRGWCCSFVSDVETQHVVFHVLTDCVCLDTF